MFCLGLMLSGIFSWQAILCQTIRPISQVVKTPVSTNLSPNLTVTEHLLSSKLTDTVAVSLSMFYVVLVFILLFSKLMLNRDGQVKKKSVNVKLCLKPDWITVGLQFFMLFFLELLCFILRQLSCCTESRFSPLVHNVYMCLLR